MYFNTKDPSQSHSMKGEIHTQCGKLRRENPEGHSREGLRTNAK
jgi:hypothetical protein